MERPHVGFIGLGTMGEPMARNVLRGGFPPTVYDRRSEPVQRLVQVGASAGASPQDVAERSDIVITIPIRRMSRRWFWGQRGCSRGSGRALSTSI